MCLNNMGDMQRLLGGGVDISYIETLNEQKGWITEPGSCYIAITTVVLGSRLGPVAVHSGYKTSNVKHKYNLFFVIFCAHQQSVCPFEQEARIQ